MWDSPILLYLLKVQSFQGVNAAGLTLTGFLYLQAIFIERGQPQSVWAVLRRYGYNNELLLDTDYLEEVNFQHNPDQVPPPSPPSLPIFLHNLKLRPPRTGCCQNQP